MLPWGWYWPGDEQNCVSHGLSVLQVPFRKLQMGCHVPFTKEWLPSGTYRPDWWTAAEMEPSGRFSGALTGRSPP